MFWNLTSSLKLPPAARIRLPCRVLKLRFTKSRIARQVARRWLRSTFPSAPVLTWSKICETTSSGSPFQLKARGCVSTGPYVAGHPFEVEGGSLAPRSTRPESTSIASIEVCVRRRLRVRSVFHKTTPTAGKYIHILFFEKTSIIWYGRLFALVRKSTCKEELRFKRCFVFRFQKPLFLTWIDQARMKNAFLG